MAEEQPLLIGRATPTSNDARRLVLPAFLSYNRFESDLNELDGRPSLDSSRDGQEDWDEKVAFTEKAGEPQPAARSRNRHCLAILIVPTLAIICLTAFWVAHINLAARNNYSGLNKRVISLNDVYNGTFRSNTVSYDWLAQAGDGVYTARTNDWSLEVSDLSTNTTRTLVVGNSIIDESGLQILYHGYEISPDMKYLLVQAHRRQVWRQSSLSNYYLHSIEEGTTYPLIPRREIPHTSTAKFSPIGNHVVYVHDNDIYLLPDAGNRETIRITDTGSANIFNGVPDWVLEEEIFSSGDTTYFSPDGKRLAFLVSDDRKVPTYTLPIYNPNILSAGGLPYPENTTIRYPKPGYTNPSLQIKLFDLQLYRDLADADSELTGLENAKGATRILIFPDAPTDSLYTEIFWANSSQLLVKQTNRQQTRLSLWLFDASSRESSTDLVGRKIRDLDFEQIDGGWAEPTQYMTSIQSPVLENGGPSVDYPSGYLDIIPDSAGYRHIALFSEARTAEPIFLTTGEWEIDGGIQAIDRQRNLLWFQAARPSTQRRLYSVSLPSFDEARQADFVQQNPTEHGNSSWAQVSIAPHANYILYSAQDGPVPVQSLQRLYSSSEDQIVNDNADLRQRLSNFAHPSRKCSTVQIDDHDISVLEIRPPAFIDNGKKKYPVLVRVYGGPGSRTVTHKSSVEWQDVLATKYGVVVLLVDGRGTGFRGRKYRNAIHSQLGIVESEDQIALAKVYAKYAWVDDERIGIWGWSYGGFLATKVIEANSGIFSLGIAVAPVIDWRMYDSIYTERYMGLLEENRVGYDRSAISNMTAFSNSDFLLIAGSHDDNVHFDNEALLLDRLTFAKVRKFRFRLFIDSDHSINTRGANQEVYEEMTAFLVERWKLDDSERRQRPDYNHR